MAGIVVLDIVVIVAVVIDNGPGFVLFGFLVAVVLFVIVTVVLDEVVVVVAATLLVLLTLLLHALPYTSDREPAAVQQAIEEVERHSRKHLYLKFVEVE